MPAPWPGYGNAMATSPSPTGCARYAARSGPILDTGTMRDTPPGPGRYWVELHAGDQGVARFPFDDLPVPGLCFTVGDDRWRVTEVAVVVHGDAKPVAVACEVVASARWDEATELWIPVET